MDNLARALERDEAYLETGRVTGSEGGLYRVETGCGMLEARRAVSCLVEPLPGDTVLVSQTASGGCHLLGILERQADAATNLAFEGDVELSSREGRLRVTAQEGIDLVSPGEAILVSGQLQVHAGEADVSVPRLSFLGTALQAQVETVKLFGKACDSVFERVSQSVRRSFRRVEELETLSAGQLNYVVKKLMSLRGKHSVITAEENVRIDGDKILMG
jgi:hypothetical protein